MLYDAIFLSSDEVLKGQQGRKAMVLFSDGVDRDSKTSLPRAIESAQRADTLVYCVYVAPEREEQQQQGGGGRQRWWRRLSGGGGYPGGGGHFPAAVILAAVAVGGDRRALRARTRPMAKRFCSRLQKKPAENILSFQKS